MHIVWSLVGASIDSERQPRGSNSFWPGDAGNLFDNRGKQGICQVNYVMQPFSLSERRAVVRLRVT